jgi:hypothetical protein
MHYTADQSGRMFFDCYANSTHKRVLDIGAMDVNGSLRRHAPSFIAYVGMDIEAGPGVDVVNPPAIHFRSMPTRSTWQCRRPPSSTISAFGSPSPKRSGP